MSDDTTYDTSGDHTYTLLTAGTVVYDLTGGGAAGWDGDPVTEMVSGTGGAGGARSLGSIHLAAGDYTVHVGAGGVRGATPTNGEDTTAFSKTAKGGLRGSDIVTGGVPPNTSVGDTTRRGGFGNDGGIVDEGGGGGSSAGTAAVGVPTTAGNADITGGTAPSGGGNGGNGGTALAASQNGTAPGGGGGGGSLVTNTQAGNGAVGKAFLQFTADPSGPKGAAGVGRASSRGKQGVICG